MEEIKDIHSTTLEWGAITNIIDRISVIEENMDGHWDELINMIADAVTEEGQNPDPTAIFFGIYEFIFRLYYRLRSNPVKRQFNIISKINDGYRITNYDYKTFKWAAKSGFISTVNNDYIDFPEEKLSTAQIRAFEHRLK